MTGWELGGDEVKWTVRLNEHEEQEFRRKVRTAFRLLNHALHDQIRRQPPGLPAWAPRSRSVIDRRRAVRRPCRRLPRYLLLRREPPPVDS